MTPTRQLTADCERLRAQLHLLGTVNDMPVAEPIASSAFQLTRTFLQDNPLDAMSMGVFLLVLWALGIGLPVLVMVGTYFMTEAGVPWVRRAGRRCARRIYRFTECHAPIVPAHEPEELPPLTEHPDLHARCQAKRECWVARLAEIERIQDAADSAYATLPRWAPEHLLVAGGACFYLLLLVNHYWS